jgi:hypothetical protein
MTNLTLVDKAERKLGVSGLSEAMAGLQTSELGGPSRLHSSAPLLELLVTGNIARRFVWYP